MIFQLFDFNWKCYICFVLLRVFSKCVQRQILAIAQACTLSVFKILCLNFILLVLLVNFLNGQNCALLCLLNLELYKTNENLVIRHFYHLLLLSIFLTIFGLRTSKYCSFQFFLRWFLSKIIFFKIVILKFAVKRLSNPENIETLVIRIFYSKRF